MLLPGGLAVSFDHPLAESLNAASEGARKNALLQVNGLCKRFELEQPFLSSFISRLFGKTAPSVKAVDNVSFELRPGEILGVLGESGSGKSTLARLLMGLYQPDEGGALFENRDLFSRNEEIRLENLKKMQMIFQDPFTSLDPRMNIGRIISEPLAIHGVSNRTEREAMVRQVLDEVALDQEIISSYPSEFSGGQRQRIGIARALVLNPRVLIADEAVSALDVSVQAQILELLLGLKNRRGLSMLFISHDVAVVRQICDRIAVMFAGQIVEIMPADCLLRDPAHPYTKRLVEAALLLREGKEIHAGSAGITGVPESVKSPFACPYAARCNEYREGDCTGNIRKTELHEDHFVSCSIYRNARGDAPQSRS